MNFDFKQAYKAEGYSGIAWRATGWEHVADEDTEWTGEKVPTGRIEAHMIGDDCDFYFEPSELTPIDEDDYCSGCGQIGCGWC